MSNIAKNDAEKTAPQPVDAFPVWLQVVRENVRSLKFGTVQVTVHDSRVVQIERVEKLRFDKLEQGDSR
jgi:hypothetical protein